MAAAAAARRWLAEAASAASAAAGRSTTSNSTSSSDAVVSAARRWLRQAQQAEQAETPAAEVQAASLQAVGPVAPQAPRRGRPPGTRLQREILRDVPAPAPPAPPMASASSDAARTPAALAPVPSLSRDNEDAIKAVLEGRKVEQTGRHLKASVLAAGLLDELYQDSFHTVVLAACRDIRDKKARGIVFIQTRMYDETPLKSRVSYSSPGASFAAAGEVTQEAMLARVAAADQVAEEVLPAKIVASYRGFAMTLAYVGEDGKETYHQITGHSPTRLRMVTKQNREVMQELLQ